jgi:NAD(P)-dependent dehydrogenase (short-subunit alcohol dehydrogenase family)
MSYLDSLFSLEGKTAVVIGGTGELCGAMAEGLAGAGASIVLVGRNPDKATARLNKIHHAHHGRAWFESCDVQSKAALSELLDRVVAKAGGVDILINGAGVNSPTPFLEITEEEYDRIVQTNMKAVFLACQVFGRYFLESGRPGSIINIGSMAAMKPLSRVFTYSATKAAVHNLSGNLAREWAVKNVRVNTLVPGFFPAEQNRKVLTPERVAQIMGHTPMKRFGEATELVGAALLLASDAGKFITGIELVVDGGFNCMAI